MRAWTLDAIPGDYALSDLPDPEPGPEQVLVRVVASALNHMDIWLTKGRPAPPEFPHVPGSDVAGVVVATGAAVTTWEIGDEVVINPALVPKAALRNGINSVLDPAMRILGEHTWGGHSDFCVVQAHQLESKPANRTWEEVVTQPICGTNAWRLLRRAGLKPATVVLVTGIGGGVASAAMAIALHLGAEVHVTSREPEKRQWALDHGATAAYDSSAQRYEVEADIVLDSIGPATWDASIDALKRGGSMCVCGGTSGSTVELNLPKLFFSQLNILGASCGSQEEFRFVQTMLSEGLAVNIDSVHSFDDYPVALDRLRSGQQMGKIVLSHVS